MKDRFQLDEAMRLVEAAAAAGERCPANYTPGMPHGALPELARQGKVRVKIYALNYRVVEILTGPHAGKQTAPPPPQYRRPFKIIDAAGARTLRGGEPSRRQPSAPRALTREELDR